MNSKVQGGVSKSPSRALQGVLSAFASPTWQKKSVNTKNITICSLTYRNWTYKGGVRKCVYGGSLALRQLYNNQNFIHLQGRYTYV